MPSSQQPSPQTTIVILLGASEWPEAPRLPGSEAFKNSAFALRKYFMESFGLSANNMLDLFDTQENAEAIIREIKSFLTKRIEGLKNEGIEARDVIVFFTGHGGFEGAESDYFLAVRHTSADVLRSSAIHIASLAKALKDSARFLRRMIILDACFAAAGLERFQSIDPLEQIVKAKTKEAFFEAGVGTDFPESGTSLLCSSSKHVPSHIAPDGKFTMFSEALLRVLEKGNKSSGDYLSLYEVKNLSTNYLINVYKDNAPIPEAHSPDQSNGDVANIPFFPNAARLSKKDARQKLFIPIHDEIQCCVLVSETEEKQQSGESLESIVRRTLMDFEDRICTASATSKLELQPHIIYISEAFNSPEIYRNTVIALCRADIAVFDLTNYEPAMMLLLGIRAVVRRGVTVATAGGDYVLGDTLDFPFNIKEVNIISHSSKQQQLDDPNSDPINLIGERVVEGFVQLEQLPNYLDLPAFDAVRNLPPQSINQKTKDYTDRVLLLCSFSREYQNNNWKKHLKRNLPLYIRRSLKNDNERIQIAQNKPDILRTLDMKTPRLVSQTLFEAIRLTNMCVIDWTEWRPNVFFELGVRISVNDIGPVCIIEDKHKVFMEQLFENSNNPILITKPGGIEEREVANLVPAVSQCITLLKLFNPIVYKAPTFKERGSEDEEAYRTIISTYKNRANPKKAEEPGAFPDPNTTYNIISESLDWKVETAARPVYIELINAANLMSNADIDTHGRSPVLYPQNTMLIQKAEEGALERRIAAWFYLRYRYQLEEIAKEEQLTQIFLELSNIIAPALIQSSSESNKQRGREIRQEVKSLREIIKLQKNERRSEGSQVSKE